MATSEEIMLTFFGRDQVSNVAAGINKNIQGMGNRVSAAANNMNAGLMNVSSGLDGMVSSLNGGKSATESIFGTSSKAETNSVLLKLMSSTEAAASKLNAHVDEVTNSSLVSMQSLIPAMNAFKTATGATDDEIYNATETMSNFGAKVLAQTGSTDLAEQAMMDLSKGIKGACASLDQYGITTDALKSTGLWDGDENDIEGYMAAVQKLTGDTKELMETNEGLDKQIEKQFSSAGKKLGNEFLPGIKDVKRTLIDLNKATGGGLFAGVLAVSSVFDMASSAGQTITQIANGARDIKAGIDLIRGSADEATKAIEGLGNAADTLSNTSEIAADSGIAGRIAEIDSKATTSTITPGDAASMLDIDIKSKKSNNYSDFLKYLEEDNKELQKVTKALEKGEIDKQTFNTLANSINKDKDSLVESFETLGEVPDIDLRNKKKNNWKNYFTEITKQNKEMESAVDLLKSGDIDKNIGKDIVESVKHNREELTKSFMELDNLDEMADGLDTMVDGADAISDKAKDMKKGKKAMEGVEDAADMIPTGAGAKAAASGAEASAASAGFSGLSAGITSMLVPLLTVAAVVAVMIPVVVALAAEALIFIRALAEVFKALNFDKLDLSGDINGLKQVGTAIWELCKAMGAMVVTSWLTMVYQGISAIMLFQNPIETAVNELKKTAELVQGFKNVTIDESVPGNLQSLSNVLGSVSKAMSSLSNVGVSVLLGSILTLTGYLGTLSDNLGVAKDELTTSATTINSMTDLDTIDEGVVSKLGAVTSALADVGKAMSALSDVNWDINIGNIVNLGGAFGAITSHLSDAKDEIIKAAPVINQFSGLPDIDTGAAEKLKKVSEAFKTVSDSMKSLQGLEDTTGGSGDFIGGMVKGLLGISSAISIAKTEIMSAAKELQGFSELPDISDDIKTKLSKVGSTAATAINTLKPLRQIESQDINAGAIASNVQQARFAISNAAIHLASLSGITQIPEGVSEILNRVGSAAATVMNTLKPLTSIANQNVDAGAIAGKVAQARYAISNTATHLASLAGMATIPEGLSETLNRVGTAATQVATAAANLNTIPVVTTTTANIALAVAAVKLAIMELNSIAGSPLAGGISSILSSVTATLNQLKTTLTSMSGGFYSSGASIGQSIVNGVRGGLAPLSGIVISSVSSAVASAVGVASAGGARIGQAITTGFKNNLQLAQAMKAEMQYVTQAVNNGISSAKAAAESGAQDIVAAFKSGIETGSPGAMAWATYDEMHFIRDFIVREGKHVVDSAKRLGQNIVTGFGNPSLNMGLDTLPDDMSYYGSLQTMLSNAPTNNQNNQPVIIQINKGAVQLDSRNLTTRESKQIMINALEGLDAIQNINIRGIGV